MGVRGTERRSFFAARPKRKEKEASLLSAFFLPAFFEPCLPRPFSSMLASRMRVHAPVLYCASAVHARTAPSAALSAAATAAAASRMRRSSMQMQLQIARSLLSQPRVEMLLLRRVFSSRVSVCLSTAPSHAKAAARCVSHSHSCSRSFSTASDSNHPPSATQPAALNKQKQVKQSKKQKASAAASTASEAEAARPHSPEAYRELRLKELQEAGLCDSSGAFLYENSSKPTMGIEQFLSAFSHLAAGEKSENSDICVAGRLHSKREASSKLVFYDLIGSSANAAPAFGSPSVEHPKAEGSPSSECSVEPNAENLTSADLTAFTRHSPKVQIMATLAAHETPPSDSAPSSSSSVGSPDSPLSLPFQRIHRLLRRGDLVWVRGRAQRTKSGELSIVPAEVRLLAPAWREIPAKLTEPNTRYRQRYLDLLVNRSVSLPFHLRSTVLASLRSFLTRRGFLEVESPILWPAAGGAAAKPFVTSSVALGKELPLFLRIAPELFLKELIIGGMERVFEVSRVFRNEGIDATHNPEFTTVELYQAYASYGDMRELTESLFRQILLASRGSTKLGGVKNRFTGESVELDFAGTWRRIDVMEGLSAALGEQNLPDPNDPASLEWYLRACERVGAPLSQPHTLPRALDKLIGALLEPQCVQPTFLEHHPVCLSPLAKRHPKREGITERFELFINGQEYVNAYSELNDPGDQYNRMLAQAQAAKAGDEEAQPLDQHFCTALEYGLPPTAGWGIGIDRSIEQTAPRIVQGICPTKACFACDQQCSRYVAHFTVLFFLCLTSVVMLLSGATHIRDVLLFPVMKPQLTAPAQQQAGSQQNGEPTANGADTDGAALRT